jgi:glycosyltransferase involved in cell wall biosynthesis
MDKISIITTFYNAQTFIGNAIASVLGQKVPDGCEIEYVLVDDKSQDNSRNLVDNIISNTSKENFKFKLVEPDTNLGCGGARKFGIENATGNYFMFLDADDYYIHLDFVENAYNTITSENADVVEYGVIYNQQNGQQTNSTAPQKIVLTDPHDMEIALFKDNLIKFNVWSKIYTRKIVESYPYSTVRTFEDVRTIPVWISNCNKVVIMPIPQINYRAASNSIIRTNWVDTRLGTISAIAELFPRFKDDRQLLKAMYTRSMIDLEAIMNNKSSECEGFDEMSKLNTYMLKFIYLNKWKDLTYNVEMDPELNPDLNKEMKAKYIKTDLNSLPGM